MSTKDRILMRDDLLGTAIVAVLLGIALAENLYAVYVLMDSIYAAAVQFAVAVICVMLEAFGLIKARQAFRNGKYAASACMIVATVLAFFVCAMNSATFYDVNFANKAAHLSKEVTLSKDLADEKGEIEDRLDAARNIRPATVIEADIALALNRNVRIGKREESLGQLTKDCTNARSEAHERCGGVLTLRSELANAVAVLPQIAKDRDRLEAIRKSGDWVTSIGAVHPGASLIADTINYVQDWRGKPETAHVSDKGVQTGAIILIMVVLQFLNLTFPFAWFHGRTAASAAATTALPAAAMSSSTLLASASQSVADTIAPLSAVVTSTPPASAAPNAEMPIIAMPGTALLSTAPASIEADVIAPPTIAMPGSAMVSATPPVAALLASLMPADAMAPATTAMVATSLVERDVPSFSGISDSACTDDEAVGDAITTEKAEKMKAAAKAFISKYCVIGPDCTERSSNVHAAYAAVTDPDLTYAHAQFTAVVRKHVDQAISIFHRRKLSHLNGLCLNEDGCKLIAKPVGGIAGKVGPVENDALARPRLTANAKRRANAGVAQFAALYCDAGEGFEMCTRDLFSVYEAVTPAPSRLTIVHFSRQLRLFLGERRDECNTERRKTGGRTVEGIRLNAEGLKLVGSYTHKIQIAEPLSVKDRRAAIQWTVCVLLRPPASGQRCPSIFRDNGIWKSRRITNLRERGLTPKFLAEGPAECTDLVGSS